jgi:hypothetical protein
MRSWSRWGRVWELLQVFLSWFQGYNILRSAYRFFPCGNRDIAETMYTFRSLISFRSISCLLKGLLKGEVRLHWSMLLLRICSKMLLGSSAPLLCEEWTNCFVRSRVRKMARPPVVHIIVNTLSGKRISVFLTCRLIVLRFPTPDQSYLSMMHSKPTVKYRKFSKASIMQR